MMYYSKDVINMLINANLLTVSTSNEYFEYSNGEKGLFSIKDFDKKFLNWANGKSKKAVLDKATLCLKLMNNNEPYEKIFEAINKQPSIYKYPIPTEEQLEEIVLNDLNKNWVRRFIEASYNKEEVMQALICSSNYEITETGWHSIIENIDDIIPTLVNESNLHILIEHKNANKAFENYLKMKYPQYEKYIDYMLAYFQDTNDLCISGKNKVLELCKCPKLYLLPEFDNEQLSDSLKGDILINGAGRIVKELASNLRCSKAEATKLVLEGKTTLDDILRADYHFYIRYPLSNPDWQTYRWWEKKKNSTEWKKLRTAYLPAGKKVHWRWIDRVDEIRNHHIHNDNESPSVVMNRVFQEAEERQKELYEKAELLKAKPSFPECPLKGDEEFKQVKTPYELYLVGKTFHNCAFNYEKALARGESFIFTSSDICAEVCQNDEGKWRIQQCLGFKNSRLKKKDRARFEKWFKNALSQK